MNRTASTGRVLEEMLLQPLLGAGYDVRKQVIIGSRPGGGPHKVDIVATSRAGEIILVSAKWQQVDGTAEQKVPFEVICLVKALNEGHGSRAYVVLGGLGWTMRDYYISGGLKLHLSMAGVDVIALEDFVARANKGTL